MSNGNLKRECWVDNVKVIACIFVVLGHFLQSMVNIIPKNNLYNWFIPTIYTFHVPLFFICSGYLYQRNSKVDSVVSWKNNIIKKFINLGIPYFTFSIITILLKTIFSGSVNNQIENGFLDTLFLHPIAPYWYLYALFFIFLITPTFFGNKSMITILSIAFIFKIICFTGVADNIQVVYYILKNEIWFVLGMCACKINISLKLKNINICVISIISLIAFIVLSILLFKLDFLNEITKFIIGVLACSSIIGLMLYFFDNGKQNRIFGFLAKYTMPIFLMHTIFAAPMRVVLLKIGVSNVAIHIVLGLAISFIGPIIAAKVMSLSNYLEFFIYPNKLIKTNKGVSKCLTRKN